MNPFSSEFSPQRFSLKPSSSMPPVMHSSGPGYPPPGGAQGATWIHTDLQPGAMPLGHHGAGAKHLGPANNPEPFPLDGPAGDVDDGGLCFENQRSGQTVELVSGVRNLAPTLMPLSLL